MLQRVLNLANDRGRELQAQTDLNKALVEVNRVEGKLLASANIDAGQLGSQTLMLTGSQVPGAVSGGVPPKPLPSPSPSQTLPPPIKTVSGQRLRVAGGVQRYADLAEDCGIVDRGRHVVWLIVGDLLHGGT